MSVSANLNTATSTSNDTASLKLFQPIKLGTLTLSHRVVMAPLTRFRASATHVPGPLARTYYEQRASTPGTLLITEATLIAERASGYAHAPGIWSDAQVAAWKEITDAVHSRGSFIYLQLWALGRAADPSILAASGLPFVSASAIALVHPETDHTETPRALTVPEIREYVALYATAASNAVHRAGFDGVEVHTANGYLVDQFLQDVSNKRVDEYGGSVEGRARFALEIVDAVTRTVGVERTGVRMSPFNTFNEVGMTNPYPQFTYLANQLRARFPGLAYVHAIGPRVDGIHIATKDREGASVDFIRKAWAPGVFMTAGGYTRADAIKTAEENGDLIAFGRAFIANPDLPYRLMKDIPLTKGDRNTYFVPGSVDPKGYIDYPFAYEQTEAERVREAESKSTVTRL